MPLDSLTYCAECLFQGTDVYHDLVAQLLRVDIVLLASLCIQSQYANCLGLPHVVHCILCKQLRLSMSKLSPLCRLLAGYTNRMAQ